MCARSAHLRRHAQNRMLECLILFESIVNSKWFARSSIILFLNMTDLFKIKLEKYPLEKYFPTYTGNAEALICDDLSTTSFCLTRACRRKRLSPSDRVLVGSVCGAQHVWHQRIPSFDLCDRYHEHQVCVCCREGNHFAKLTQGCRSDLSAFVIYDAVLFVSVSGGECMYVFGFDGVALRGL